MRSLLSTTLTLTPVSAFVAFIALSAGASAQSANNGFYNPGYNNTTYSYGLQLPQVPQPNGQDEIRAADGTTCRSSMASNNAYLDMGGIGGQGADGSFDSGTVYGRLIMPLGDIPKRLDCSSLYNLEIERLRNELQLIRAGLGGGSGPVSDAAPAGKKDKAWAENGWSNGGSLKPTSGTAQVKPATRQPAPAPAGPAATIVPMHLLAPVQAPAEFAVAPAYPIEFLPWSKTPAEGARVLTAGNRPKRLVRDDDDNVPDHRAMLMGNFN